MPAERALQHRIRRVLAHLGDPHLAQPVVHVGGSAGKGSTSTMIASILRAAGLRTGLYTSPHLQTFIERVDVDGRLIAPDEFAETVLGLEPLVRQMHLDVLDGDGYGRPALVEVAFAAGMKRFAAERCDAAVVEVGIGGRTDCTNVFDEKAVSVITNVEYEHRERLGWSLRSIATEKSAIIRGDEIVVTGARQPDVLRVIEDRCAATGATLWRLGRDIRVRVRAADRHGSTIDVTTPRATHRDLRVALAGVHQTTNAALAVAAAEAFDMRRGREISAHAIAAGLANVRISGRMEQMSHDPVVLLDAAHNPVEIRNLVRELRAHWIGGRTKLHLVCGILADKDQAPMARALASVADTVIVTQPPLAERIGDPERMTSLFCALLGEKRVRLEPLHTRALDLALEGARPPDVICVTGSMFLIGALRERWMPESRILRRRTAAL